MDLKDYLIQIADRITKTKDNVLTEEATKMSFIVPVISALGYDVYNPLEVVPEFTCDAGIKKGEKIDYAIHLEGKPIILVECKHYKERLEQHDSQLMRYFNVSKARFAILTNGIEYKFFTDLDDKNVMDSKPFLVINMLDLPDKDIEQLKKFHKSHYDENNILSSANELKYTTNVKQMLTSEFASPSVDFVKLIARKAYDGQITQRIVDQFTPFIKNSISSIISDTITERLSRASKDEPAIEQPMITKLPDGVISISEDGITTTQDELDAYMIIKNIARQSISDVSRILFKDYKSYATISLDKEYNWFVRLYMGIGKGNSYISFFDIEKGKGERDKTQIKSLDEIYNYSDKIVESLTAVIK